MAIRCPWRRFEWLQEVAATREDDLPKHSLADENSGGVGDDPRVVVIVPAYEPGSQLGDSNLHSSDFTRGQRSSRQMKLHLRYHHYPSDCDARLRNWTWECSVING